MVRPRGSRRIEIYGLKLDRRVQCFGEAAYGQWVCLEADPSIQTYCERPAFLEIDNEKLLVDFWIKQGDQETLLIIGEECSVQNTTLAKAYYAVKTISQNELAAAQVWIENWERILPIITSCRGLVADTLLKSIEKLITEPMQLSHIERELATSEPTIVRGAIFTLLHRGQLRAPQLLTEPLSFLTRFEPVKDKS
jgi:hypothetical protein